MNNTITHICIGTHTQTPHPNPTPTRTPTPTHTRTDSTSPSRMHFGTLQTKLKNCSTHKFSFTLIHLFIIFRYPFLIRSFVFSAGIVCFSLLCFRSPCFFLFYSGFAIFVRSCFSIDINTIVLVLLLALNVT